MRWVDLTAIDWLVLARHELLLFAATFFLIGALDEIAVDLAWLWLRMRGRGRTERIVEADALARPLTGPAAVLIPTWREEAVIAATIEHALRVWPHDDLRVYVGCYANDPLTPAAAIGGAGGDPRLRVVVHDVAGPTCKADCLNRLYGALLADEAREGFAARMVLLHDAEDMVDPAALALLDEAIQNAAFVQLPVLALPDPRSPLVAGHYADEFAEAHGKAMVVRSALGQGIPGAGVGCAVARAWLARLDVQRDGAGPFATGSLTEDYELGLQIAAMGGKARFLRARTMEGRLIATRSYFPHSMRTAIRQKTRWLHGIALQGWDRLGWRGSPVALWMQLRDRRGPLAALLLALAYVLLAIAAAEWALGRIGVVAAAVPLSPAMRLLLWCNLLALAWRLAARFAFTTREFGVFQGLLSVPRVIVSNTVAIVAARRALFGYVRSLRGERTIWDKTEHIHHPALLSAPRDLAA